MKKLALLTVIALHVVSYTPAWAQSVSATDTYVLELNGPIPDELAAIVADAGGELLQVHPEIGVATARSEDPSFASRIERSKSVKSATQDYLVQWTPEISSMSNAEAIQITSSGDGIDPTSASLFPCQWNLSQIDAPGAWDQGVLGDPGVKVAVLDTGVDPNHGDLAGKVDLRLSKSVLSPGSSPCNGAMALPDEESFRDFYYHGTFVASQITTNNRGMAGVAPNAEIVAVKVLNCRGRGSFGDVIAGILYAAGLEEVGVINMSLGAYLPKNLPGSGRLVADLNKAVNVANSKGKLVVVAAGNNHRDLDHDGNYIFLPAQSGAGISIYATGIDGSLSPYSNFGRSGTWVGAPGGSYPNPSEPLPGCSVLHVIQSVIVGACSTDSIVLNCDESSYMYGQGTSFAAPLVAGVAALVDGKAGGALNGGQIKTRLAQTADDLGERGTDSTYSHGRVNARRAVQK